MSPAKASVAIIDYGLCNLDSIRRAIEECGGKPHIIQEPSGLANVDRIILPGVGAFSAAMANLSKRGFDHEIREILSQRPVPFLGICLGMQLLARRSEEGGKTEGLGIIDGEVIGMVPTDPEERVPHIGWNEVTPIKETPLLHKIRPGADFYFVHRYHFRCHGETVALASTPYCGNFTSIVGRDYIFGVQFHPEKSQKAGFQLLRNFLAL